MASSSVQIHVLGSVAAFPSSRKPAAGVSSSKSLFFGHRHSNGINGAFLNVRRGAGRENQGYGNPLRVVSKKVEGIDLGTTNSAVAAMEGGKPTIVTNAEGQRSLSLKQGKQGAVKKRWVKVLITSGWAGICAPARIGLCC